jgi:hypothetical protein
MLTLYLFEISITAWYIVCYTLPILHVSFTCQIYFNRLILKSLGSQHVFSRSKGSVTNLGEHLFRTVLALLTLSLRGNYIVCCTLPILYVSFTCQIYFNRLSRYIYWLLYCDVFMVFSFCHPWKKLNVCVKMTSCCAAAPCSVVDTDIRIRGAYCLHHQGDELPWWLRQYAPVIFILAAVSTRKLTECLFQ